MQVVPLILAMPILIWIAWTDFQIMRIRNSAVMAAAALFVITTPLLGWHEAGLRFLAAALVFAIGFALFAARVMGGGDVKMGAALLLFVPTGTYTLFAFIFSGAMLLGIVGMVSLRSILALRRAGPVSLRAKGTFPMGVALALSGFLHLGVLVSMV